MGQNKTSECQSVVDRFSAAKQQQKGLLEKNKHFKPLLDVQMCNFFK